VYWLSHSFVCYRDLSTCESCVLQRSGHVCFLSFVCCTSRRSVPETDLVSQWCRTSRWDLKSHRSSGVVWKFGVMFVTCSLFSFLPPCFSDESVPSVVPAKECFPKLNLLQMTLLLYIIFIFLYSFNIYISATFLIFI